jgi:hypothetical protein
MNTKYVFQEKIKIFHKLLSSFQLIVKKSVAILIYKISVNNIFIGKFYLIN